MAMNSAKSVIIFLKTDFLEIFLLILKRAASAQRTGPNGLLANRAYGYASTC
jgi:hypothetical protein